MERARVTYAVPWLRIVYVIAMVMLLGAGSVAIAVISSSGLLAAGLLVAQFAIFLRVVSQQFSAQGDALLTEDELLIEPRHRAICTWRRPLRILWSDINSATVAASFYGSGPFVVLRTVSLPGALVVNARKEDGRMILLEIADRAANWHAAQPGATALRQDDLFSSLPWRIAGVLLLCGLGLLVAEIFFRGRAGEWANWIPPLALSCGFYPFLRRVFRRSNP